MCETIYLSIYLYLTHTAFDKKVYTYTDTTTVLGSVEVVCPVALLLIVNVTIVQQHRETQYPTCISHRPRQSRTVLTRVHSLHISRCCCTIVTFTIRSKATGHTTSTDPSRTVVVPCPVARSLQSVGSLPAVGGVSPVQIQSVSHFHTPSTELTAYTHTLRWSSFKCAAGFSASSNADASLLLSSGRSSSSGWSSAALTVYLSSGWRRSSRERNSAIPSYKFRQTVVDASIDTIRSLPLRRRIISVRVRQPSVNGRHPRHEQHMCHVRCKAVEGRHNRCRCTAAL